MSALTNSRPVLEHLNSAAPTASTSADVPSVFETLAAEELRDLIQPAFRYVLAFFAQRYPRYLLRLINRHEEVYALFLTGVEGFHLNAYNSTFTHHFYGLQFRSLAPNLRTKYSPASSKLSRRQKLLALSCIVGIPYVRSKAQDLYERLGGGLDPELAGETDNSFRITPRRRITHLLSRVFCRLYPWVNLGYELLTVGYDLGFAFGKGWGWRWWMRSIGIEVVRASPGGEGSGSSVGIRESGVYGANRRDGSVQLSSKSSSPILRRILSLLSFLRSLNPLATTLLALKFLQWWYSPASPRLHARKAAEERAKVDVRPPRMVPPAIKGRSAMNVEREVEAGDEGEDDDSSSSDEDSPSITPGTPPTSAPPVLPYGACCICTNPWRNPTITPTGYMGCYLCLYRCVERDEKCPVTGLRMRTDELRKVAV